MAEEGHGGGDVDDQGMAISGRTNREPCVYASDREREAVVRIRRDWYNQKDHNTIAKREKKSERRGRGNFM